MTDSLHYPDFLCIGAQKSGTTWLFDNLQTHPAVCIPMKELNYFNFRGNGVTSMRRVNTWRAAIRRQLIGSLLRREWDRTLWTSNYLFRRRTDAWYASLFDRCRESVHGDISPNYSALGEDDVRHVRSIMPDARIILLLRDPVERAWSHARMDFRAGMGQISRNPVDSFDDLSLEELRQHFDHPASLMRTDYPRTLQVWGMHFRPNQIFIGYLEEIASQPRELLDRIAAFLGIEPLGDRWPRARERVNAAPRMSMPQEVAQYLSQKYLGALITLETHPLITDRRYVSAWRQRAEQQLASL